MSFLIGLAVGAVTGGTIVGAIASAVFRLQQADTDHWCPDAADSALRARQYAQENHDELAALGGDR